MDDSRLPVVCRACGRTTTMGNIKFDDNRKEYVCSSCFKAGKPVSFNNDGSDQIQNEVKKVNYQCDKCSYSFSKVQGKNPGKCPYCGHGVLNVKDKTASRLLDESEGWD